MVLISTAWQNQWKNLSIASLSVIECRPKEETSRKKGQVCAVKVTAIVLGTAIDYGKLTLCEFKVPRKLTPTKGHIISGKSSDIQTGEGWRN